VSQVQVFVIPGAPVPKPRQTRRDRWMQRPEVMAYRAWADQVRRVCGADGRAPAYELRFFLPIPQSYPKKRRSTLRGGPHQLKPDIDNLVKAALDALLPDGDQKVCRLRALKCWEDEKGPRTEIIPWGSWSQAAPRSWFPTG